MAYVGPMKTAGQYRIMIYGPKEDGTYVVEFRTDAGQVFALSIPSTETAVIRRFKERMPYGLFVPPLRGKRETPYPKNEPHRSGARRFAVMRGAPGRGTKTLSLCPWRRQCRG
jgi:hypothetical protein